MLAHDPTFSLSNDDDIDDDDDNDEVLNRERERRYAELRTKSHKCNQPTDTYGSLEELATEQALLHHSLHTPRLIVHFHRPDFRRCAQMSAALSQMAALYPSIRFVQVEATRAPFLTAKWAIQLLPCVVRIDASQAVDKIVGFEGVMTDGTEELDLTLLKGRLVDDNDNDNDDAS